MNMEQNPVLFWLIWVLLRKKKKTHDIHVMFEPITPPEGIGGTYGTPPMNGIKWEYPKYLVAKIYDGEKYLGWFTRAYYYSAYGFCISDNLNGVEYIDTRPIGSNQYKVAVNKWTINGISATYTSNFAIHSHYKYDSIIYSSNGTKVDESHDEYDTSFTFNFNAVEQTFGDENISGGTVNVFGDGMTLEKYKEVFKEFPNATFGFSNGGTEK